MQVHPYRRTVASVRQYQHQRISYRTVMSPYLICLIQPRVTSLWPVAYSFGGHLNKWTKHVIREVRFYEPSSRTL